MQPAGSPPCLINWISLGIYTACAAKTFCVYLVRHRYLAAFGALGLPPAGLRAAPLAAVPRVLTPGGGLSRVAGDRRVGQGRGAVLGGVVVGRAGAALESQSDPAHEWVARRIENLTLISHEELKARLPQTQLVVRTGESTPFANVILHCGVPF